MDVGDWVTEPELHARDRRGWGARWRLNSFSARLRFARLGCAAAQITLLSFWYFRKCGSAAHCFAAFSYSQLARAKVFHPFHIALINAVIFSPARTTNRFPLPRCASAIQIVGPLESIAETQPQLHWALLRLSAMVSQYFTR